MIASKSNYPDYIILTELVNKGDRTPEMITATNKKLDRLKTLYIDGLIDLDTYKADRADLMTQLEDLQRKAAESHTEPHRTK